MSKIDIKKFTETLNEAQGVDQIVVDAVNEYIAKHGDSFELYADYNDRLDTDTFAKFFDSEDPVNAFYEHIMEGDWNTYDEYKYIVDQLNIDEEYKEEHLDEIMDYVQDHIAYQIPFDHYDSEIGFDVYFKTEDYNENTVVWSKAENREKEEIDEIEPSIVKLLESQGYTKEAFIEYYEAKMNEEEVQEQAFFKNLIEEIENCTYNYGNEVVLLCQGSFLEIAAAIRDKKTITIPDNALCGLHNGGNGSGSTLDISLEKPVTGVIGQDLMVYMKDAYHYNVDETHGLVASAWNSNIKVQG